MIIERTIIPDYASVDVPGGVDHGTAEGVVTKGPSMSEQVVKQPSVFDQMVEETSRRVGALDSVGAG